MKFIEVEIKELIGKILTAVEVDPEVIVLECNDGSTYRMHHYQDCCERVTVEDVVGDISDIIGSPLLEAEEVISLKNPDGIDKGCQDSFTWTFYKFGTIKGHLTIRWYGESNGYYSERVTLTKMQK
jgi:hypothetical protein